MSQSSSTGEPQRRASWPRVLIGWGVSLACLAAIAWNVDLEGVLAVLVDFDWRYLGIGVVALACGYAMRIVRWTLLLRSTGAAVTTAQCVPPFLGSIALNNVLPMRAGDVVRAVIFPAAIGVRRAAAIGSIVMERLADLLTLLLCLALGAGALHTVELPGWLADTAIALTGVGVVLLFAVFAASSPLARVAVRIAGRYPSGSVAARVLGSCGGLLERFTELSRPRPLVALFVFSVLGWIGEMGLFWSLFLGFGFPGGPLEAFLVMAFVTLATLVPSSPGYVGPFHLAGFTALVLLGADEETATSFAVLAHAALWVPTTLAGSVCLLARPSLFRGPLTVPRIST